MKIANQYLNNVYFVYILIYDLLTKRNYWQPLNLQSYMIGENNRNTIDNDIIVPAIRVYLSFWDIKAVPWTARRLAHNHKPPQGGNGIEITLSGQ